MRPSTENRHPATRVEIRPGVWLDSRLAVWFEALRALVVADLHWGYAASHRARGNLVPAWGDPQIGERLRDLIAAYQPAEMIWLGDIVHAAEGAAAAETFLRDCPIPVSLVAGNHDRRWRAALAPHVTRGPYFFHHGDRLPAVPVGAIAVSGHIHPAAVLSDGAGGNVKVPALVDDPDRLILPAFSPWAAGTSAANLMTPNSQLWAIAPHRIFALRAPARISAAV